MTQRGTHTTGIGRLVGGDAFKGYTTSLDGTPLKLKDGSLRTEFSIAVAYPKGHPDTDAIMNYIGNAAREDFPALFQANSNPQFSYKVRDGDSTDAPPGKNGKPGKPWCDRDGYAGHIVVTFKQPTQMSIVVDANKVDIIDSTQLKRGDFVRVVFTAESNKQTMKPGLFITHKIVQRLAFGAAIQGGGIDVDAALGATPMPALPAGASATPLAPAGGSPGMQPQQGMPGMGQQGQPQQGMPGMGQQGQPQQGMPGMGQQGQPQQGMPGMGQQGQPQQGMQAPGTGVNPVNNFGAPEQVAAQAAMQGGAPGGWVAQMHPQSPFTYEQLVGQSYTVEQMRQQGYVTN